VKSFSNLVVVVISLFFIVQFNSKLSEVYSNEKTCVCAYDGFGYYLYLPALFDQGTLNVDKEWSQSLQNEYCNGIDSYQLVQRKNGNYIDVYHMGLAFVELPSYIVSDQFARWLGYKTDGFSKPYQYGFLINALLFILLGIYFLRKLLRLFFEDKITAALIAIVYLASNFYITSVYQYDLTHIYLFALNAIFLYHFFKFCKNKNKKHLLFSAIILGLTFAIRPTQILWGILPLVYFYNNKKDGISFWKSLLIYPLFAVLWNIPHLFYWKIVGGELILPNLHTEEIIIVDPNLIDFLFSYRKGWLLYSPVFILFFISLGVLFKKNRVLFWSSLLFSFSYILVASSWETWWYAASFGARPMIETYPLLLIGIGFLFQRLRSMFSKIVCATFVLLAIVLNLFQSSQFSQGILHADRMSKEHYWYIFGRSEIDDYTEDRLLINRNDSNWIDNVHNSYQIETKEIFSLDSTISTPGRTPLTIGRISLLDELKTDETSLEVTLKISTSDSTQHCYLQMETCSSFNCYKWETIEVSFGLRQDVFNEMILKFNVTDIRHRNDYMQIYLYNPEDAEMTIEEFKVVATSIIRP